MNINISQEYIIQKNDLIIIIINALIVGLEKIKINKKYILYFYKE